jgi:hypothetical protein
MSRMRYALSALSDSQTTLTQALSTSPTPQLSELTTFF